MTSATATSPEGRGASRTLLIVAGALIALIAIAGVIVMAGSRPARAYPVGSAEAAFQAYYTAFERGDLEDAYGQFSRRVKAGLSIDRYRQVDAEQAWLRDEDLRISLERVDASGDRATLHVRADHFSAGGLGGNSWSSEHTIRLVQEDGAWRIDDALVGVELAHSYAY